MHLPCSFSLDFLPHLTLHLCLSLHQRKNKCVALFFTMVFESLWPNKRQWLRKKKKHKSPQLGFVDDSKNGATNQTQNSSRQPHNKLRQTTNLKKDGFFQWAPPTLMFGYPLFTVHQAITHLFDVSHRVCDPLRWRSTIHPRTYVHGTRSENNRHSRPSTTSLTHLLPILCHTATCPLLTASFCFCFFPLSIF